MLNYFYLSMYYIFCRHLLLNSFSKLKTTIIFSFIDHHKHILGVPPIQSHGAEADCLALLHITLTLGSDWNNKFKLP